MKLTIERGALLRSLGHVQSVVERRTTIPILSNVQIQVDDNGLGLTATDLDLAVSETLPVEVVQAGATTAPAHTLYDIVRKLPDGAAVELATGDDGQRLSLSAGRTRFSLACLPIDDFPVMAEGEMPFQFTLSVDDIKQLVDKTRFAISTEETRYYLNGIYLHIAEDGAAPTLRAVATDGHRLARFDLPVPQGAEGMPGIIIPRKTVGELRKMVDEAEGSVAVALSQTKIRFSCDQLVLTSKLIDGTFPEYDRVIPSGNDKIVEIDSELLAEAVDRVSTISTEKSRAVKLSINGPRLELSANSPDQGTASDEMAITCEDGLALDIGFNSRYLLDILSQIEGERVIVTLADSASPTLMRDASDDRAIYVLMPMRV